MLQYSQNQLFNSFKHLKDIMQIVPFQDVQDSQEFVKRLHSIVEEKFQQKL